MIGQLPDTLADRSIPIRMARKKTSETVERLRMDRLDHFKELSRQMQRWADDHRTALAQAEPEEPEGLNDRAADNWRPLFAIADAAGGRWPAVARQVALQLSSASPDNDQSVLAQLLADLQELFAREIADKLFSKDIVDELGKMEDRPWPEWQRDNPITTRQLARLLAGFGIRPQKIRMGEKTLQGYRLKDFEDAFERYANGGVRAPEGESPSGTSGTSHCSQQLTENPIWNTEGECSGSENAENADSMRVVPDVPDHKGGAGRSSPLSRPNELSREVIRL